MKVLVVGSGGREHSIIWNLSKDKKVKEIICIGDNAGISKIAKLININIEDLFLLEKTIKDQNPDLVVIGPEGGFEEEERAFISGSSKNFFNVSLGPNILKADTAVIAALSLTFHYFS